jgi:hypothetical protein
MATNTYVELDKVTVGTAVSSVTFSSIPATYTDLVLVASPLSTTNGNQFTMQFNSDSASNYSATYLSGTGSAAASYRRSSQTSITPDYNGAIDTTNKTVYIFNIMNYANTTTNKTVLIRSSTGYAVEGNVALWRKTPEAISSIVLSMTSFNTGSTFSLYGIKSEEAASKATGGIVTSDSQYFYHTFIASGTFTPKQSLSCDILIVAGGGGGGGIIGGGGGAGGLRGLTNQSLSTINYTISIGAGGVAGVGSGTYGTDGVTSTVTGSGFTTLASTGGGNGGGGSAPNANGRPGGSGAGGSYDGGGGTQTGGAGNLGGYSPVEGYAGASGGGSNLGGGGGGATATGSGVTAGNGSSVYSSWGLATSTGQNISGTYWYAGGGGGGTRSGYGSGGAGGNGGGGAGSTGQGNGTPGTANTGGGGGGAGYTSSLVSGSNGGSGIIIVRYAK